MSGPCQHEPIDAEVKLNDDDDDYDDDDDNDDIGIGYGFCERCCCCKTQQTEIDFRKMHVEKNLMRFG